MATSLGTALVLAASRTDLRGWRWSDLPPAWILTLVAIALFLGLRALYRTERGRAELPARLGLALLRTILLMLLLLVLAGPYREEITIAEERSHLVLLVDDSGSMNTVDRYPADEVDRLRSALGGEAGPGEDATRLQLVQAALAPPGETLLRQLDRRFVVHAFAFDVDWRGLGSTREEGPASVAAPGAADPVADVAGAIRGLTGQGSGTNLGAVLRDVAVEFLGREDRHLGGVLLLSDGRETSEGEGPLDVLVGLGPSRRDLRVSAVALGNPSTGRNVRVERIRAMDVVLVEDDVLFETALRHQGFAGLDGVRAALEIEKVADEDRTPLAAPRPYDPPEGSITKAGPWRLGGEEEAQPVRLQARMTEAGTYRVRVKVLLPPEAAKDDAIEGDNESVHWLRVVDQRIKVLYVDNLPRYELRWLGSWLTREPPLDPARPERRRRYEAQVLQQTADPTVAQRSSPDVKPLRNFPRTRRDLFEYDVVILGDIDWMELGETVQESRRILELIREFVQEGGGIAFQAGEDYNNPLKFRDTPLQDLLPITPRDRDQNASEERDTAFRIQLTEAGLAYPTFGIAPRLSAGLTKSEDIASLWRGERSYSRDWRWYWMYRSKGGVRPGAVALARVLPPGPRDPAFLDDSGRPAVVFAHMPYGRGRVFFSALDAIWRIRKGEGDRFYGPFWDQLIRHLATYRLLGGNRRFKISTDREQYFAGETATVTITALTEDYEPLGDPFLEGVHVENPDGEDLLLTGDQRPRNLTPEGAAPGTFRLFLPLRKTGGYRLWITDPRAGGGRGPESRAERRIEVEWRSPERRQTIPDHDLLRRIVEETGGQLLEGRLPRVYDLEALVERLEPRTIQRVINRREQTQWDRPWVLLLLVGLLALEWLLRKRWQMI